jgi:uncharacterized protein YqeY
MSSARERLENDVKAALKAGEKERLSTLRMLLSELKNEALRTNLEPDEPTFVSVVRKAIKQRQEAATQYRDGQRPELADKETREAEILSAYLPRQVAEDEIQAAAAEWLAASGLSGKEAMGPAMKALKERFGSTADGAVLNRVIRGLLS